MTRITNLDDYREEPHIVLDANNRVRVISLQLLEDIANGDKKPEDIEDFALFFQDITKGFLSCIDELEVSQIDV